MQNRILTMAGGIAIVAVGMFLIGSGLFQCDRLADMEATGHVQDLSSRVRLIYTYLGKWGVLGIYSLAGALAFVAGLDKLMNGTRARA